MIDSESLKLSKHCPLCSDSLGGEYLYRLERFFVTLTFTILKVNGLCRGWDNDPSKYFLNQRPSFKLFFLFRTCFNARVCQYANMVIGDSFVDVTSNATIDKTRCHN